MKKAVFKVLTLLLITTFLISAAPYGIYVEASDSFSATQTATISIDSGTIWMNGGKKRTLKVSGSADNVTWTSSNTKVAKVSSTGVVTAVTAGSTVIFASTDNGTAKCKVHVYTPESVRKKMLSLKKKYPEGMSWTNKNRRYYWKATNVIGHGCYAFAALISDSLFGVDAPVRTYTRYSQIKPGDHIRIGGHHSLVVIKKKGNKLTVAEGNFDSSVHWGRVVTKKELQREGFYVETRYW